MQATLGRLWALVAAGFLLVATIVAALLLRFAVISPAPAVSRLGSANSEALGLYERAQEAAERGGADDLKSAVDAYDQATACDPAFAAAWAGSAIARVRLAVAHVLPADACMPQARTAALRALDLDGSLPEAHLALAGVKMWNEWEWERAEGELQQAIVSSPGLVRAYVWYGVLSAANGDFEEANFRCSRAMELDPRSVEPKLALARTALYAGCVDDAIAVAEPLLDRNGGEPDAPLLMAAAAEGSGADSDAVELARSAIQLSPDSPEAQAALARSLARTGRREEAAAMIEKIAVRSPYAAASVQVALGGDALSLLDRALAERDPSLIWLSVDPAFDALRCEPRLRIMIEKLDLLLEARTPRQFTD